MSEHIPPRRATSWIAPVALLVLAALAAAAALFGTSFEPPRGWWPVAIVFALCAVAIAVWELRRLPPARAEDVGIEPNRAAAVRAERERAGEEAAVRMLRSEQPEISLDDAVRLVREL